MGLAICIEALLKISYYTTGIQGYCINKSLKSDIQRRSATMHDLAIYLIFCFSVLIGLGMFGVFLICMYLREFPKVRHKSEADLEKKIYKSETEVDKAIEHKKE